jgi:hypothetical protein
MDSEYLTDQDSNRPHCGKDEKCCAQYQLDPNVTAREAILIWVQDPINCKIPKHVVEEWFNELSEADEQWLREYGIEKAKLNSIHCEALNYRCEKCPIANICTSDYRQQ